MKSFNDFQKLDEATKYVVHYTDSKGQHVNSSKAFDDKSKADAHAAKGNAIDKVGGKYSVKPMQNEEKKDDVPFDPPYKNTKGDGSVKDKSGAVHTPMSRARDLARRALQNAKKANEEYVDEGMMDTVKKVAKKAAEVLGGPDDEGHKKDLQKKMGIPQSGKPSMAKQNEEVEDLDEKLKGDQVKLDKNKNGKLDREDFKKLRKENKTAREFMDSLLEYESDKSGRYVHTKGSYGKSYDSEKDDNDDKPKSTEKRGRGRPAGSKSGARDRSSTGKSYGGVATHSLNLPNSNK